MCMKLTVLSSTIAALMLFTLSASAQGQRAPAATTTRTADYVEQKELGGDQIVKFTGDELVGELGAPGQSLLIRGGGPVRCPLIRPRLNFVPELLKSVENL